MERRIAVIMLVDVVGFSHMAAVDEDDAITKLRSFRDCVIEPSLRTHRGRLVKTLGDGFLIEFASVVDAIKCAIAQLHGAAEVVENGEPLKLRLGINLGDVVVEGDDIVGDGVNVAARLQERAEPNTIFVSRAVFEHAEKKVNVAFEDLGEQQLKNIPDAVRIYKVLPGTKRVGRVGERRRIRPTAPILAALGVTLIVAGSLYLIPEWRSSQQSSNGDYCDAKTALTVPDQPSIAVLPFEDSNSATATHSIGEILGAALTTSLSKVPDLFVISERSSVQSVSENPDPAHVADDLGVRYLIEGKVLEFGGGLRINAQLIDTQSGETVWAESYDQDLESGFRIIDEISFKIVNALEVALTQGEQARIRGQGIASIEAYQLYAQAMEEQLKLSPEGNAKAVVLAKKATEIDPGFWGGWVALGYATSSRYWYGSADKAESLDLGMEYAERALEVGGPSNADAYTVMSFVQTWRGNYDEAIRSARIATELSPNMADAWGQLGITLNSAGRPGEAIPVIENAMRLSPYYPRYFLFQLAKAYRLTEQYEDAISANRKLICLSSDSAFGYRDLALSYAALDRMTEARAAISDLSKIFPDYTVSDYLEEGDSGFSPEQKSANAELLRISGLPEAKR